MSLRFDQPEWLLLALAALPLGVIALRWFSAMSAARRWSAVLMRLALMVILAAMLAGATMLRESQRVAVIAVVDVSGSIKRFFDAGKDKDGKQLTTAEAIRGFLDAASVSRKPDDLAAVVIFDGQASAAQAPIRGGSGGVVGGAFEISADAAMGEGTDIEGALRLAGAMIPPDAAGRIVLFSDGAATAGNTVRGAEGLAGMGATGETGVGGADAASRSVRRVPVDVVPLNFHVKNEVYVESVDSPPTAPAGSTVPVRVVLFSASEASGTLQLLHEGDPIDINGDELGNGLPMRLSAGRTVKQIVAPLGEGRVHRFEAVWEPDAGGDTILTNNHGASFTVAPGRGSVLLVDGVSGGDPAGPGATLANSLRGAGIDVQSVGPDAVQSDLLWLQAFDLIILQNVGADAMPRRTHGALTDYVTQLGGGLIMVGGPDSFGAGGWKGSEVEPILPVRLDLPERLVTPAAAIVIIIDNSGSMNRSVMGSDRSQQDVANDGAAVAVESMDKSDLVGVISFNSTHTVEVPLGPNRDPKATAAKIREISADGGTFLPPALERAHRDLRGVGAEVKHVIVLSDGVSMGKEQLPDLVKRMAKDNIQVSCIAVGDDADSKLMAEMASIGGGRFYRVIDANLLPRIFLKAVRVVRTPMIREVPFKPLMLPTGSPVTDGLSAGEIPQLNGLVLTQSRLEPTVVTNFTTPTGEPVLAYWNAGLGRVAAFTSDAHNWTAPWMESPVYARVWAQLARAIARPPTDRSQTLTAEMVGDRLMIRLDATREDGRPLDLLNIPGSVYAPPDGGMTEVRLSQIGPGQYETTVLATASGTYVITLTPRLGERMLAPVIGGVSRPAGAEYRRLSSDMESLRRVAEITGGKVFALSRPGEADVFSRAGVKPAIARTPLWPMLAVWAIVVLLLDVATRRIAWDRLISREFGSQLKRDAATAVRDRTRQAQATVEQLRKRDEEFAAAGVAVEEPRLLTDEDAADIVRQQAERRKKAREDARRAATGEQVDPLDAHERTTPEGGRQDAAKTEESGLMAAKRRARQRMQEEE